MKKENAVIKKDCHSRGMLSGIYNACRCHNKEKALLNKCVEDPRLRLSGMTPNLMGFTLIELLVVVLIIGILAAVAVPQYQKAVAKSQAVQLMTLAESIGHAAEFYYIANGKFATSFNDLDVEFPADWTGNEKIFEWRGVIDVRSNGKFSATLEGTGGIIVGNLSGPYKGAGFAYYLKEIKNSAGVVPPRQLLCTEVNGLSDYLFSKQDGDYCVKLFNGVKTYEGAPRLFTLPSR